RRSDRRFCRLFAIQVNCSTELCEFALRRSKKVSNLECDRRMRRIDLENLICNRGGTCNRQIQSRHEKQTRSFHRQSCFKDEQIGKSAIVTQPLLLCSQSAKPGSGGLQTAVGAIWKSPFLDAEGQGRDGHTCVTLEPSNR